MKKISYLIMIIGVAFVFYAAFEMYKTNSSQKEALIEAEQLVEAPKNNDNPQSVVSEDEKKDGDILGIISIPVTGDRLPIVKGTDERQLGKGVGHYTGTAMPGENDQIVLSGHRETVFKDLGKVKKGDLIILELANGKFAYRLSYTKIVDADDRTIIKSTYPEEVLTLTTCYPFNFIGDAPQRYIIFAEPDHSYSFNN